MSKRMRRGSPGCKRDPLGSFAASIIKYVVPGIPLFSRNGPEDFLYIGQLFYRVDFDEYYAVIFIENNVRPL